MFAARTVILCLSVCFFIKCLVPNSACPQVSILRPWSAQIFTVVLLESQVSLLPAAIRDGALAFETAGFAAAQDYQKDRWGNRG